MTADYSMMLVLCALLVVANAYQQVSFYKNITLDDLDGRLVKMIKDPQKDKGDDLMDGSFWYYSQLEDMEKDHQNKKPNSLDVIREFVKRGEPKFINEQFNKTVFKKQFLWDKGDFLEFNVNVEGTKWIWDKFLDILSQENSTSSSKR